MARNAASYFRSATMFAVSLLMVQVHVSTETTSVHLPACGFSFDTIDRYGHYIPDLIHVARGNGSVTLQDVTCICHIGKPKISVFFPEGEENGQNQYSNENLEVICRNEAGIMSCTEMPDSCNNAEISKNSTVFFSGNFTQKAVITCRSTAGADDRAPPLIVWPVPRSTSVSLSPSKTITTTVTTEEGLVPSSEGYIKSTTAEPLVCVSTMTETISATTTMTKLEIVSTTTTITIVATTTLTETSKSNLQPGVVDAVIVPTTTAISILIFIIVILLVALTVTIIIARSSRRHTRDVTPVSAVNQTCIEQNELVESAQQL